MLIVMTSLDVTYTDLQVGITSLMMAAQRAVGSDRVVTAVLDYDIDCRRKDMVNWFLLDLMVCKRICCRGD